MKTKRIFFIFTLIILCGCGPLNWLYGVDDNGKDTEGDPPIEFWSRIIQNMGPIGTMVATGLAIGGSVYVGHKEGKANGDSKAELAEGAFKAVVKGVEDVRNDLPDKQEKALVNKLKKKIPNKWHGLIDTIRDTL